MSSVNAEIDDNEYMSAAQLKGLVEQSGCGINLLDYRDDFPPSVTHAIDPLQYAAVYTSENSFSSEVVAHVQSHAPASPVASFNTAAMPTQITPNIQLDNIPTLN